MSALLDKLKKLDLIPSDLFIVFENDEIALNDEHISKIRNYNDEKVLNVLKQKYDAENLAKVEEEKKIGTEKLRELNEKFSNVIFSTFSKKIGDKAKRVKGESDDAFMGRIFQELELVSTPAESLEYQKQIFKLQSENDELKNSIPLEISKALQQKESEFSKQKAKMELRGKVKSLGLVNEKAEELFFQYLENSISSNGFDFRVENDKVGFITKDGKIPVVKNGDIETNIELTPDHFLTQLLTEHSYLKPVSNGATKQEFPVSGTKVGGGVIVPKVHSMYDQYSQK